MLATKDNDKQLTSNEKGRHAELLAQTALLANGWSVSEPIVPESFDLSIRRPGDSTTYYVQVKTASLRNEPKYNGQWIIAKGAKNNGERYTREEVDYFIAVWQGEVYMFPNTLQREYWVRPWDIENKWTKLETGL